MLCFGESEMKICPHCQKVIEEDDARYCPYCGAPLPSSYDEVTPAPAAPVSATGSARAIVGMVLGIVSSILSVFLIPFVTVLEILLMQISVAGIIVSATAIRTGDRRAKVGLALNIIATAIAIIAFMVWLVLLEMRIIQQL